MAIIGMLGQRAGVAGLRRCGHAGRWPRRAGHIEITPTPVEDMGHYPETRHPDTLHQKLRRLRGVTSTVAPSVAPFVSLPAEGYSSLLISSSLIISK